MTEPSQMPDPRWRWEHEQLTQRLRVDHENLVREFRDERQQTQSRLKGMEDRLLTVLSLSVRVDLLTTSMDKLSDKLDQVIASAGIARKSDWTMALQVGSLAVAVTAIILAAMHSGVVHP